jgi:hypothetical protein
MKTILLFLCYVFIPLSVVYSSEPRYTVQQINGLIEAGKAKSCGACFANQALGCRAYLWKDSNNHHVFFFLREGTCYGEYRDEVLADGRFLSTTEKYLVSDSRNAGFLAKSKVLPFVCKETENIWTDHACIEKKVRWMFVSTDRKGNEVERGATVEQRMSHRVVNVFVPDRVAPHGKEFFIGLTRKNLSPHELAFGSLHPVVEHFGLTNGRCSIWALAPDDDAVFSVVLSKRIPDPKVGTVAFPDLATQRVASMTVNLDPPSNTPFVFVPDSASP